MRNASKRLVLLDTNVLVTAIDPREGDKAIAASAIVWGAIDANLAVITVQVITEYFDTVTRRKGALPPMLDSSGAARSVETFLASCRCLDLTPMTIFAATRAAIRYQMRLYDAHIWATARLNGVPTILTEDTPSRAVIEDVRYVDPFAAGFRMSQIGL